MAEGERNVGLAVDASGRMFGDVHSVEARGADVKGVEARELLGGYVSKSEIDVEQLSAGASSQIPFCPTCIPQRTKVDRDGLRYLKDGSERQRYICYGCGLRFSEKVLKTDVDIAGERQICAGEAKNLHVPKAKCYGTGELPDETKALITVFEGWLQKEGYAESCYPSDIKTLANLGADLMNPEDVKVTIGAHKVKDGTKMLLCYAYEAFLTMQKMTWDRPTYKQEEIIPFIPEETELDQLIAAAHSKRMAAYLQVLKETFTDPGEAIPIERHDVQGNYIAIRHPVKNHRPRTLEVSDKLIAMLKMLPTDSDRFFDCKYQTLLSSFVDLRARVASMSGNDRIRYIELRSYRHWAGTKIAEMSNGNPISVMKLLGLRNVENAMKYVNIWKLSFKTETQWEYLEVTTPDELKAALLGGYQHVIDKFGASWFRRAKRIAFAGTPIPERADLPQCPPLETPVNKRETCSNKGLSSGSGDVSRADSPSFSFLVLTLCCVWVFLVSQEAS